MKNHWLERHMFAAISSVTPKYDIYGGVEELTIHTRAGAVFEAFAVEHFLLIDPVNLGTNFENDYDLVERFCRIIFKECRGENKVPAVAEGRSV